MVAIKNEQKYFLEQFSIEHRNLSGITSLCDRFGYFGIDWGPENLEFDLLEALIGCSAGKTISHGLCYWGVKLYGL